MIKLGQLWLGMVLFSAPALAADQFDLVCTGKRKLDQAHFRVDLQRGEWCADTCKNVAKIEAVTSGEILLYEHKPAFRNDKEEVGRISRVTGAWYSSSFDPSYMITPITQTGTCESAPFSGLPTPKF